MKGRDWYDFEWYIRCGHKVNLEHLTNRAIQSSDLKPDEKFCLDSLVTLVKNKAASINIEMAKADIEKFIPDPKRLELWSAEYFGELSERIEV